MDNTNYVLSRGFEIGDNTNDGITTKAQQSM